jgi:putative Mg2+ transporter-C (MgtC) family protein
VIGLERQWRQRLAGLRTNTLVALGAAIFVAYSHAAPDGADDTRSAAQVVSGIGFLGAGVIFKISCEQARRSLLPNRLRRVAPAPDLPS